VTAEWPRPVVHWEIIARDPDRQADFYRRMFHWDIGDGPIMQIPAGLGAPEPGPAGHLRGGDAPAVVLYVQVQDLEVSLVQAAELGGKALSGAVDIPGGPTIAFIEDPEGNALTLVQQ
jgi:predicted enzyme related to lactoylglutathione lyase